MHSRSHFPHTSFTTTSTHLCLNNSLGASVDDSRGDGPGSYSVTGNVWHLDCCNPEHTVDGQGWNIFAALVGLIHFITQLLARFLTVLPLIFIIVGLQILASSFEFMNNFTLVMDSSGGQTTPRSVPCSPTCFTGSQLLLRSFTSSGVRWVHILIRSLLPT